MGLEVAEVRDAHRVRPSIGFADEVLTEPVPRDVEKVLREVERAGYDLAVQLLAPFGLHPYDIAAPEYRRVIYEHECPIFAALQRKCNL